MEFSTIVRIFIYAIIIRFVILYFEKRAAKNAGALPLNETKNEALKVDTPSPEPEEPLVKSELRNLSRSDHAIESFAIMISAWETRTWTSTHNAYDWMKFTGNSIPEPSKVADRLNHEFTKSVKDAGKYRSVCLDCLLDRQYEILHTQNYADPMAVNIAKGLAYANQKSDVDLEERQAWRWVFLAKMKECYPNFESFYQAILNYYKVLIKFNEGQQRNYSASLANDEIKNKKAIKTSAENLRKTTERLGIQIQAMSELNETSWIEAMETNWKRMQPIEIKNIQTREGI